MDSFILWWEANSRKFDEVERYDPTNDTWAKEAPMPTARHGLGSHHMMTRYLQ
ncbi:MAG: hypothetical protein AB7U98_09345 [Candidatus Nitrosocosmicus sp.]